MNAAESTQPGWSFWIDRGGTFTDLVGRSPIGELVVRKVLSRQPELAGDPAVAVMRELLALAPGQPIPSGAVSEVRIGTTVATNTLLEDRGAPTLLLISRGFADAAWIDDQHRPDLFALHVQRPAPRYRRVLEVEGRLAADGTEITPLVLDATLERALADARSDGLSSCAVALLHSARHPRHELQLAEWLAPFGFEPVVLSHQVGRRPRLVPRAQTAVVEATVAPALAEYLDQLRCELGPHCRLRVMQSSGGLVAPELLKAKDTILSGPAGGMVAAVRLAAGSTPIVGFDMGGTSTDVFHVEAGGPSPGWERRQETEIAGLSLQAEMLPIHTVAAGGGSLLHFDGQRLQVGPSSAGADPGPACYRRGGPLTITDANLLLGRLQPEAFPAVFGPGRDQGPDAAVVRRGFQQLAELVSQASGVSTTAEDLAEGALAIAIERMAEAIRRISIQRGHDVRGATLICFGGAGGQHACALAERLGMARVLLHPLAGVFSAYGIGLADQRLLLQELVRLPLDQALVEQLQLQSRALLKRGRQALTAEARADVSVGVRLGASERTLTLPLQEARLLRQQFELDHERRFGHRPEDSELVVEWLLVEVVAPGQSVAAEIGSPFPLDRVDRASPAAEERLIQLHCGGAWRSVPLHRRDALKSGERLDGPALVVETTGTIWLAPGWLAECRPDGCLLLSHGPQADRPAQLGAAVDPVSLELFNHRFSAIAEQMGVRLQQSARSVNIRERLDFSCALFDCQGQLVANAPHIPVHLGSMGASVESLLSAVRRGERPPLKPGDAIVSNDPANGGTHLPDLTVITPVFVPREGISPTTGSEPLPSPAGFVASRGHHADVGGITPGSMPPFSRCLADEGLLLDNVPLLRDGVLLIADWQRRLASGPHPVRNPEQLLADLQAQVAANQLGAQLLVDLARREGLQRLTAFMGHVQDNGAEAVRRVIDRLEPGAFSLPLDGGLRIQVTVCIDHPARRAVIDFTGTSPQDRGNRNAPLAITRAVVLYVFRCLVGESVPLNAGCFRPLELVVPPGCLLHPSPTAAVVAGNVETSQAIANALFAALGVMAAAQGTMNNLCFGNQRHQYYETICGGCGAGRGLDGQGFAGASAVQSHMTNSRLTDPEILEERFPVRLEAFGLRRGSGGVGRWRGGDGVMRRIRFLEPMTAAILSGSREVAPFGLAGGGAGALGRNRLIRADGSELELGGSVELALAAGEALVIETPGGGGYGGP
ncbi:hydantoinase B/oxoprolinase family protein [Synechococcus sp. Cruz-9H2]|uniref:hydantoinase B/oxoprolinase family protein n=1 Tax=unclassified Synechococcus TaxID=2626047 RepID=UPI0020CB9F69|nr:MULTISPECIES: hydantoinase B/oxoprolinase family protein [unclassified Synechococcus]MCP9817895.1 hydantoinase B/oxoprolinase family protein [Synechococcus sp. Cruz-9H2]MCP9842605.1 hydantoinase B/oxoprolinase family protein [Synechococcus sp. Edmonson 11F2]MCP9854291.1 hydantoinase B/oxoprolinase family protein [Synechococcus sp. Cruz-9C9]MCP9862013.1 hydantoinase B/oxoprolinase family protein [Synechococcus sp. Cruz-7E5]MCP9868803.1 hydantoinase B/oxoprolinase family protein [Synechococcu